MTDAHLRLEFPSGRVRVAPRGRWTRWSTPDRTRALELAEVAVALRHTIEGRMWLDDLDLSSLSLDELARWRASCVCLCRRSALEPRGSPLQLVLAALRRRGVPPAAGARRARDLLRDHHLDPHAACTIASLPRAARARAVMARAAAQEPELVVLHHPAWRCRVRALRERLRRGGGPGPTVLELGPVLGPSRTGGGSPERFGSR